MTAVAVHEDTEDDLVVEAKNEGADGETLYHYQVICNSLPQANILNEYVAMRFKGLFA